MHPGTLIAELVIANRYWFRPLSRNVSWKRASCVRGEQEATTSRLSRCLAIMSLMCCWLVSEQVYRLASAWQTPGNWAARGGDVLHVHNRGDVVPAVTDEHAHPRSLIGDIPFPRVFAALDHGATRGSQLIHGACGRSRSLGHRFRNILRLLESSSHVDAGLGSRQRGKPPGLGEAEFVRATPRRAANSRTWREPAYPR